MKVVLFCGGLGTRLKEYSETIPKPMVDIGFRPIMWHLMRYYAHFGHKDFILCLGYRGDVIKNYFLNYNECYSNNFTLTNGGKDIQLHSRDIDDWTITFVDTGINSNIGMRLKAVQPYLQDEEVFMANYTDGLADLYLPDYIDHFCRHDKIASFVSVLPSQSFHVVSAEEDGLVSSIAPVARSEMWINGGFFILRNSIFDFMRPGEELVQEPFYRLIEQRQLVTYRHHGFWACMDTYKEKKMFDEMYERGNTPWTVWDNAPGTRLSSDQSLPGWTSERYVPTANGFQRVVSGA
jgi:glucose-1-phosphate cytidylyltransferase